MMQSEMIHTDRVLIVDDVISTGESLAALENLVEQAGGNIVGRMAVLAEGVLRRTGTPEEILDCGVLERSFHVAVERVRTEDGWRYYCRKT